MSSAIHCAVSGHLPARACGPSGRSRSPPCHHRRNCSNNVSIVASTGLEIRISDRLTTRLSYTIDYDSNPPPRAVSTDTLSRFTLVYAF